jgi:hypothetical protein
MQFDLLNKLKQGYKVLITFCSLSLISVAISPSAALSTACIDAADQLPKLLPDLYFLLNNNITRHGSYFIFCQ